MAKKEGKLYEVKQGQTVSLRGLNRKVIVTFKNRTRFAPDIICEKVEGEIRSKIEQKKINHRRMSEEKAKSVKKKAVFEQLGPNEVVLKPDTPVWL